MLLIVARHDSNFPTSSVMEKCKLHVRVFEAGDILVKQKENDSPHVILPRSLFHNFQASHGALGGSRIGVEYSSAE